MARTVNTLQENRFSVYYDFWFLINSILNGAILSFRLEGRLPYKQRLGLEMFAKIMEWLKMTWRRCCVVHRGRRWGRGRQNEAENCRQRFHFDIFVAVEAFLLSLSLSTLTSMTPKLPWKTNCLSNIQLSSFWYKLQLPQNLKWEVNIINFKGYCW